MGSCFYHAVDSIVKELPKVRKGYEHCVAGGELNLEAASAVGPANLSLRWPYNTRTRLYRVEFSNSALWRETGNNTLPASKMQILAWRSPLEPIAESLGLTIHASDFQKVKSDIEIALRKHIEALLAASDTSGNSSAAHAG